MVFEAQHCGWGHVVLVVPGSNGCDVAEVGIDWHDCDWRLLVGG